MTAAPAYVWDHDLLLRLVQDVRKDREAAYPHLVAEGKLTAEQSADGIAAIRAIDADWQRVVDLRAGREAQPLDATVSDYVKRETLAYVHERATRQLAKICADLRRSLEGSPALDAIDAGLLIRPALREAHKLKLEGWPHGEVGIFLALERRVWLTEALLWHAERWPLAMMYAEMQAELIARDRGKQAA
jgi:hypothetical protein